MLLFDGQVHYDTHVILMGNYVMTFALGHAMMHSGAGAPAGRQRRERLRLHAAASARLVPPPARRLS
jgi:hypothetical protein